VIDVVILALAIGAVTGFTAGLLLADWAASTTSRTRGFVAGFAEAERLHREAEASPLEALINTTQPRPPLPPAEPTGAEVVYLRPRWTSHGRGGAA
jgi:hypothetical protein